MAAHSTDTDDLVRDLRISLDTGEGEDPVAAYVRVQERIQQLVKDKRAEPGADVVSRMLAHPEGLSDDAIVQDLISVVAAAQQPTANWICNTLRLLLTDDRFALNVSGGRVSVGEALTEVLWLDTPTQNFIGRWAVRDTLLGGRRIKGATAWSSGSRRPTPTRRSGPRAMSAPRGTAPICPSPTESTAAPIRLRCSPTSSRVRPSRRCWSVCPTSSCRSIRRISCGGRPSGCEG